MSNTSPTCTSLKNNSYRIQRLFGQGKSGISSSGVVTVNARIIEVQRSYDGRATGSMLDSLFAGVWFRCIILATSSFLRHQPTRQTGEDKKSKAEEIDNGTNAHSIPWHHSKGEYLPH